MNIEELYSLFKQNGQKVTTDSRKVEKGSIFFALKGDKFDGNDFAQAAIEKGAALAVVDKKELSGKNDKFVLVEDSLKILQELARFHRKKLGIKVIAITGTAGKTTTKELTAAILSKKFNVAYTKGNLNNHIGVPLTLLSITEEHDLAVIEMGASYPKDIEQLCNIALPEFGLITNIGTAHIEGFGSHENLIKTKTELYEHIKKHNGLIFLNRDDHLLTSYAKGARTYTYATREADVTGMFLEINPLLKFSFTTDKKYTVQTKLFGKYNFENALAAAAIGNYFGIEGEKIKNALEQYEPKNNRSQITKTQHNTLILDLYNANPTSMRKALQSFSQIEAHSKIVIMGDMLELGEIAEEEHKKILQLASQMDFEQIFTVGEIFGKVNNNIAKHFESAEELAEYLKNNPLTNKTVLLKASRAIHLETVAEVL